MVRVVMAAASAFLLSGCFVADFGSSDRYQTDFHYTWDLQPTARVEAESFDGAIEVEGWDENRVEITGVKYGSTESLRDAVKIDVRHSPDSVQIRAVKPSIHAGGAGARFTIHVPRQATVDRVTTSNGSIRVHDVARAAHLKSSNGSIKVENVNGDLDAHTSNSSIDADGVRGSVALRTSNGRIHAENIDGQCEAQTTNSSIAVRMDSAVTSPLKLTTPNGSIDLTLTKPPKSDVRAETSNSSITVRLPADVAAHVTADTSNSSISSDFDLGSRDDDHPKKHHLEGTIGSGGPNIELTTSNGRIRIVKGNGD